MAQTSDLSTAWDDIVFYILVEKKTYSFELNWVVFRDIFGIFMVISGLGILGIVR